jgi:tRNA(adenine34) deaminase
MSELNDEQWMQEAIGEARQAAAADEVPVACIIVRGHEPLARAHNLRETRADPTAHAEIIALSGAAKKVGNWRLHGTTVYCTLEPCCMCAGALINARVDRLVYGLADPKSGACGSVTNILELKALNHRVEWRGGVLADEVLELMRAFFRERR